MPHRTLSLTELSEYLHLAESDIRRLAKRREIPFRRLGDQLVFPKNDIDQWASRRLLDMDHEDMTDFHSQSTAKVHDLGSRHALIPELMQPNYIDPDLDGKTKPKVIHNLIDLADRTGMVWDRDGLLSGVKTREELCSTALPGGVALPHPPHHEPYMFEDSFLCLGRSVNPILFGAPDGATTDFFFLVCAQEDQIHLHLLARLSMICYRTEALIRMRAAETAGEMLDILVGCEEEVIARHSPARSRGPRQ